MISPGRVRFGIAIALLLVAGAGVLSFAPGGWGALPIVQYFDELGRDFAGLGAIQKTLLLAAPLAAGMVLLALRDAWRWRGRPDTDLPPRMRWPRRSFALALLVPPLVVRMTDECFKYTDGLFANRAWVWILQLGCVLLAGLWLAAAFSAFRDAKRAICWVVAGMAFFAVLREARIAAFDRGEAFQEVDRLRSPDGTEYVLLSRTEVRGWGCISILDTIRIGRVHGSFLGVTRYETLVETQWEFTSYGVFPEPAFLVRPEGVPEVDTGRLVLSEDGFLAAVNRHLACFVAFDTHSRRGYGQWHGLGSASGKELRGRGMASLPLFRLLEAGGRPAERDVMRMEALARRLAAQPTSGEMVSVGVGSCFLSDVVQEQALEEALQSGNTEVRKAAARIIRAGGERLFPEAHRKLR